MKKVLHMVGHSHIDPVWFWRWEEGMQEVKATFRSALERMEAFADFRFTSTSAAFFAYVQRVDPELFEQIRRRVQEGRWEIVGGWWVEPDCNLPCGEAFVRQGLYGQAYFQKELGVRCTIGANVDSFGHHPQLPQILKKSGMEGYVFLRPQVTTSAREYVPGRKPVFLWRGLDGTALPTVSLPGEYTTWFLEPTRLNIQKTVDQLAEYPCLPCCYGVGDHGGGPTEENIRAVEALRPAFDEVELRFSGFEAFFAQLRESRTPLPITDAYFDHVNPGCYSADARLKRAVRQAEYTLLLAEKLSVLARLAGGQWMPESTQGLWERLLFNQFHDTLGGTVTLEAHQDAMADLQGVKAQARTLAHLAMQDIARNLALPSKGTPVLLFNLSDRPYDGLADVEINWFCQDELSLWDAQGREVPYARLKQSCTMVWNVLGGRRRVLFPVYVPAFSCGVYYALPQKPRQQVAVAYDGDPHVLDNGRVRLRLNDAGEPVSLKDLRNGFEALHAPCRLSLWRDERDPWGGGPRPFHPMEMDMAADAVECVENSALRKVLRVQSHAPGLRVDTLYILRAQEDFVSMEVRLWWDKPWHQLRLTLPVGACRCRCESPYGVMVHGEKDAELFMQRFLDLRTPGGEGLAVVNDGLYAFQPRGQETDLILLRSPIYAQGTSPDWYREKDVYRYMDLGEHAFTLRFYPHGKDLTDDRLFCWADQTERPLEYLVGSTTGNSGTALPPAFALDGPNVRLGAAKRAQEGEGIIFRLHETCGRPARATLTLGQKRIPLSFGPYEIKTLRLDGGRACLTNLLEDEVECIEMDL